MIKKIEEYLEQLREKLEGADPALIQDALSDAEEHLSTAWAETIEVSPDLLEADILEDLIEKYGTPGEVASSYKKIEWLMLPALAYRKSSKSRSFWAKFFGVIVDAKAWGAFLYILLSGLTAVVFGMWAILGGTISLISLILIVGIPVTGLFFLSLRGIALMEGRIVEALLGIRMPRRPIFLRQGLNWRQKYKALTTEAYTWKVFAYLILHFPLGIIYFFVIPTLFALSIKCAVYPLWFWGLGRPLVTFSQPLYPPALSYPLVVAVGILLLFSSLHLAKFIGRMHGRFAKYMLVRNQ
jgi:hypothetical protein